MQTRKADRIMAGQNHAERKTRGQFSMILSGHDSVFLHLVAAWPRCISTAFCSKLLA